MLDTRTSLLLHQCYLPQLSTEDNMKSKLKEKKNKNTLNLYRHIEENI